MATNKVISQEKKNTSRVGDLGENIAVKHLVSKGFTVIETNYRKAWGELDIVAQNNNIVHFVEVKTHTFSSKSDLEAKLTGDNYRPEELVHQFKMRQITRTVETWLMEHKWEGEWMIDVVAVRMAPDEKYATINHIENIVI